MKRILSIVLVVMLFVMVGCGSEPQAKEQKLSKLTIGLMPDTDSIPFIIAAEYGYFAEEGLEIELIQKCYGAGCGASKRQPRRCGL